MLLPAKTTLTVLTFCILAALPDYVPFLRPYKILEWSNLLAVLQFKDKSKHGTELQPIAAEEERLKPSTDIAKTAIYPLTESEGSLDAFYASLFKTEQKQDGAVTEILHYGDSPTTADLITADVRLLLQKRFGDAGHGYCLVGKPWAWYGHQGIEISSTGWKIDPATQGSGRDGVFGLGGVSFTGAAATTRLTVKDGAHTAIEIDYWQQPNGGTIQVDAENEQVGEINTGGEVAEAVHSRVALPMGTKHVSLHVSGGAVRMFGVSLEKDQPGVRYNSLGLNGAYVSVLARFFKEAPWGVELQHYQPSLVVVNYGTNESMYANFVDYQYAKEMREVIRRLRVALPNSSVLIMSPMDRGQRDKDGTIGTPAALTRLVNIQEKLAAETHCAFFNTYEAMGGEGTMGRWYDAEPRMVSADFIHPMPAGAKLVGNLLFKGLMDGYNKYKLRRMHKQFNLASTKK